MINNIEPRNSKGKAHGLWKCYYSYNDKIRFKCFYHNGVEVGYE